MNHSSLVFVAMFGFLASTAANAEDHCSDSVYVQDYVYGSIGQSSLNARGPRAESEAELNNLCQDLQIWCREEYWAILDDISDGPNAASLEREAAKQHRQCKRHYNYECEDAAERICRAEDKEADQSVNEAGRLMVRRAQNLLSQLGYDPGPIDGIFGSSTTHALLDFGTDHPPKSGFIPIGYVNREMLAQLEAVAAQQGQTPMEQANNEEDEPEAAEQWEDWAGGEQHRSSAATEPGDQSWPYGDEEDEPEAAEQWEDWAGGEQHRSLAATEPGDQSWPYGDEEDEPEAAEQWEDWAGGEQHRSSAATEPGDQSWRYGDEEDEPEAAEQWEDWAGGEQHRSSAATEPGDQSWRYGDEEDEPEAAEQWEDWAGGEQHRSSAAIEPEEQSWPYGDETEGSSHSSVREVQSTLAALRYNPGPVDGLYGRRTVAAITRFQRDHGMVPDGRITDALLAQLETLTIPPLATEGAQADALDPANYPRDLHEYSNIFDNDDFSSDSYGDCGCESSYGDCGCESSENCRIFRLCEHLCSIGELSFVLSISKRLQ